MKKTITSIALMLSLCMSSVFAQKAFPKINTNLMAIEAASNTAVEAKELAKLPPKAAPKLVYGGVHSNMSCRTGGFGYFDLEDPVNSFTMSNELEESQNVWNGVRSGAYVDGKFYAFTYKVYSYVCEQVGYGYFDLKTGEYTRIGDIQPISADVGNELHRYEVVYSMAHDYNSKKTYAMYFDVRDWQGQPKSINLASVDVKTGKYTKIASFDKLYLNLAIDHSGNMYGLAMKTKSTTDMTVVGTNLFKLTLNSDNTVTETLIAEVKDDGGNSFIPTGYQDMDFDHEDWVLRWNTVGLYGTGICELNPKTGVMTNRKLLGSNCVMGGMYVPFTPADNAEAPGKVKDLKAVAGAIGASIALSWTNPTLTWNRNTLTTIKAVDVYRNNTKITTLTGMEVGKAASYTDNSPAQGMNTYKVIARRVDNENGKVDSVLCFAGVDLPGIPGNLKLTSADGTTATVSWEAPKTGKNGGWFDNTGLTYTVTRMPDSVVVKQGIAETTITDSTMTSTDYYYYRVVAKNKDGEGEVGETNKVSVGPAIVPPYSALFDTEEVAGLWTIYDQYGWGSWHLEISPWKAFLTTQNGTENWIFSPLFKLEADKSYKVRFLLRDGGHSSSMKERVKLWYGKGATPADMTELIGSEVDIDQYDPRYYAYIISPKESGQFRFGVDAFTEGSNGFSLFFGGFSITPVNTKDLAAVSISGIQETSVDAPTRYSINVANNGAEAAPSYKVRLVDELDYTLAEVDVNESLAPQQEKTINITWTPTKDKENKECQIFGRVIFEGDGNSDNDTTDPLKVKVNLKDGGQWYTYQGLDNWEKSNINYIPLNYTYKSSCTQVIYSNKYIGLPEGEYKITKIGYEYNFETPVGAKFDAYLASTEQTCYDEGSNRWISKDLFTKVASYNENIQAGSSFLIVNFDAPFSYSTDQNLVVTIERPMSFDGDIYDNLFKSVTSNDLDEDGVTIMPSIQYGSNKVAFNWDTEKGYPSPKFPITHFYIISNTSGISEVVVGSFTYNINGTNVNIINNSPIKNATLYNINGMALRVADKVGENNTTLNINGLNSGVYILKVNDKSMKLTIK